MNRPDILLLIIKELLPLAKKLVSKAELDQIRFNVGTDGIFIYKPCKNGRLLKIEISFNNPDIIERA